jgi:bifunctional DNA-binding transcriptional regulator/antitoxin component of YhaV-PrlF toxin-antitoxin module
MRITSEGPVTIPQEIRNRLGLLPHTDVELRAGRRSRPHSQSSATARRGYQGAASR